MMIKRNKFFNPEDKPYFYLFKTMCKMGQMIQKTVLLFLFFAGLALMSCSEHKYPGYKKTKSDIYYKLHTVGEENYKAQVGDYITVDISYKRIDDSLFFSGRRKFQITPPSYKGSVDECFTLLAKQEKATFILSADSFFIRTLDAQLPKFISPSSDMKIVVEVLDVQTKNEYEKEKEAFLNWINDFGNYEKVILKQFIEEEKLDLKPTNSGLLYLVIEEGEGKRVEKGDTILVHYEGKFLNGKFFDSTKKRDDPFQFVYGQKWQVIEGLEEAIGMMKEGERALFILPSDMAFGERGSSTGIIPPFTSVIFEVELLSVK